MKDVYNTLIFAAVGWVTVVFSLALYIVAIDDPVVLLKAPMGAVLPLTGGILLKFLYEDMK